MFVHAPGGAPPRTRRSPAGILTAIGAMHSPQSRARRGRNVRQPASQGGAMPFEPVDNPVGSPREILCRACANPVQITRSRRAEEAAPIVRRRHSDTTQKGAPQVVGIAKPARAATRLRGWREPSSGACFHSVGPPATSRVSMSSLAVSSVASGSMRMPLEAVSIPGAGAMISNWYASGCPAWRANPPARYACPRAATPPAGCAGHLSAQRRRRLRAPGRQPASAGSARRSTPPRFPRWCRPAPRMVAAARPASRCRRRRRVPVRRPGGAAAAARLRGAGSAPGCRPRDPRSTTAAGREPWPASSRLASSDFRCFECKRRAV